MKNTILFIFGLFCSVIASGQESSSFYLLKDIKYQADYTDYNWQIGNHLFAINGYVKPGNDRAAVIYKIDLNTHDIVKQIELLAPESDLAVTDVIVSSDQCAVLTGEWKDHSAKERMRFFLMKIDSNLNIIWSNFYPTYSPNFYYSEGVVECTDKKHFLITACMSTDTPLHINATMRIIKTDSVGQILWEKVLTDTFKNKNFGYGGIVRSSDGNYIASCLVKTFYYHPQHGTYTNNAVLYKIDEEAQQIWTQTIGFAKFIGQSPCITPNPSGGCYYGWVMDSFPSNNPEWAKEYIYAGNTNQNGATTWKKPFRSGRYYGINHITQAKNNDLIGVGYYEAQSAGQAWVFRISPEGELRWERLISDSLINPEAIFLNLVRISELEDGRLALSGTSWVPITEPGLGIAATIIVVGADGCYTPGCGDTDYITMLKEPFSAMPTLPEAGVYPNPVTESFSIYLPESITEKDDLWLTICDSGGQKLHQRRWSAGQLTDASGWPEGIYYLLLSQHGQPVASGRLIRVKSGK